MVLIPLALTITDKRFMKCYSIVSISGIFALFPLVYKPTEQVTKVLLLVMYVIYTSQYVKYTLLERMYITGFVGVYIYMLIHPLLFASYDFLPLLLCSVYTSIGVTRTYLKFYSLAITQ